MDLLRAFSRLLAVLIIFLLVIWISDHLGGLHWYPAPGFFNYHPLFMASAFVIFMGESILSFRTLPNPANGGISRPTRKLLHVALHVCGLVCVAVGLSAVFLNHKCEKATPASPCKVRPDLYTPHGWVGLSTTVLMGLQFLGGFYAYWIRAGDSLAWKTQLMPYHRYLGTVTFFMGLASMLMGLAEKQAFMLGAFKPHDPAVALPGYIALLVVLFAAAVGAQFVRGSSAAAATQPLLA